MNRFLLLPLVIAFHFLCFTAQAQDTVPGNCLHFDSVDDYVDLDEIAYWMAGHEDGWTVSGWFRPGVLNPVEDQALLGINTPAGGNNLIIILRAQESAPPLFSLLDNGDHYGPAIERNYWYHFCYTREANTARYYLNGELISEHDSEYELTASTRWSLGQEWDDSETSDFYGGNLDEIQFWTSAHSTQVIREDMHLTLPDMLAYDLVAYFQCNATSGTNLQDATARVLGNLINIEEDHWVASSAPVGGGVSSTCILSQAGSSTFGDVGLSVYFSDFTSADTLVASRLNLEPNRLPDEEMLNQQYWILQNYGSGAMPDTLSLRPVETLSVYNSICPQDIRLHKRALDSISSWSSCGPASVVDAQNNSAHFSEPIGYGQFLITREEGPVVTLRQPARGETNVPIDADLAIHFDRLMEPGPGNVRLVNCLNGHPDLIEEFAATELLSQDSMVHIHPSEILGYTGIFGVEIDTNAFHDQGGTCFAGNVYYNDWIFDTLPRFASATIPGVTRIATFLVSGDFDADGDQDLVLNQRSELQLRYNDQGDFSRSLTLQDSMTFYSADITALDFEGDGDLDLFLSYFSAPTVENATGVLLLQEADSFHTRELQIGFCDYDYNYPKEWVDYDHDGDEDLLIHTTTDFQGSSPHLFNNHNGTLTEVRGLWHDYRKATATWVDYNSDGWLDLHLIGRRLPSGQGVNHSKILLQVEGAFTEMDLALPISSDMRSKWRDFDADGDPDCFLYPYYNNDDSSRFCRNDEGTFVEIGGSRDVNYGFLVDFDNDGDLDLADGNTIYRNVTDTLNRCNEGYGLSPEYFVSDPWLDIDGDGDLDYLQPRYGYLPQLRTNQTQAVNLPPAAPQNLRASTTERGLLLSWEHGGDDTTRDNNLCYSIQLGTKEAPTSLYTPRMDPLTGERLQADWGNVGPYTTWEFPSSVFASEFAPQEDRSLVVNLQAIDNCKSSSGVERQQLTLNENIDYLLLDNPWQMGPDDMLQWEIPMGVLLEGFELQLSTSEAFNSLLWSGTVSQAGVSESRELMTGISLRELGVLPLLTSGERTYWRMRPIYQELIRTSVFSNVPRYFVYTAPPAAPQNLVIHSDGDTVTLNWDPVPGELVYYRIFASGRMRDPFPDRWLQIGSATADTTWSSSIPAQGMTLFRVQATVVIP